MQFSGRLYSHLMKDMIQQEQTNSVFHLYEGERTVRVKGPNGPGSRNDGKLFLFLLGLLMVQWSPSFSEQVVLDFIQVDDTWVF